LLEKEEKKADEEVKQGDGQNPNEQKGA